MRRCGTAVVGGLALGRLFSFLGSLVRTAGLYFSVPDTEYICFLVLAFGEGVGQHVRNVFAELGNSEESVLCEQCRPFLYAKSVELATGMSRLHVRGLKARQEGALVSLVVDDLTTAERHEKSGQHGHCDPHR